MKLKEIILLCVFLLITDSNFASDADRNDAIKVLRATYYQAAENEEMISEGLKLQENLKIIYPADSGLFTIYEGAFYTLKAKYAFWPNEKLAYAHQGLDIMDRGLAASPDNMESLFIHGTISDNLPFFMGRSDDATADFKKNSLHLNKESRFG